ncbi:GNAT family N-acetyltransferase [Mesorhizobium sp. LHD-90]|nr:GNAT family N-acetyltransferase [Mesorhizobium sp. LHD-90]MDQ6434028.1 GNAT family N-acetyltransferase [Mesorhizobium sp. LHD-90]
MSSREDAPAVREFYDRAADYVSMESGGAPDDRMVEDFFAACPPGSDLAASGKLGVFLDRDGLVAIADMAFGYPEAGDAYIGLLLIDPAHRGKGLGQALVEHLAAMARTENAGRMLVAVLDENVRGRAFWEREGFRLERSFPPAAIRAKTHVRHRMQRPL